MRGVPGSGKREVSVFPTDGNTPSKGTDDGCLDTRQ